MMKRIVTLVALLSIVGCAFAGGKTENNFTASPDAKGDIVKTDWRNGRWQRNVPEHLLNINLNGAYVISSGYKNLTPFGVGLTAGYLYKARHWSFAPHFAVSYGGYLGAVYYRGATVKRDAQGARHEVVTDRYKSHTNIPFMLNVNLHYDFNKTSIYLGLDAGVNMMIGEKDFESADTVFIQKNTDELRITRFVPTAKAKLGFTQEFTPSIKMRVQAGVQYELGYKDDFNGVYYNGGYFPEVGKTDLKHEASLDPFVEVGLVISL